jgi:hypothetical protein
MKNLHITKPGSQNTSIDKRAVLKGAGASAPSMQTGGVDLKKGYNCIHPSVQLHGPAARNHGK